MDSDSSVESSSQGLEFLAEMEERHNQVLEDLNSLNSKIEFVLEDFLKGNRAAPADEPAPASE